MELLVAGLSHRTAPISLRERLALGPAELPAALDGLLTRVGLPEGLILSTCNRTEIYGRPESVDHAAHVRDYLAGLRPELSGELDPDRHLYLHRGDDAVRHLFRVVSGLDSLVLGEVDIARQVNRAYDVACSAGAVGPVLNRAVPRALQVGKRVRTRTSICRGIASVAGAAVSLVDRVFRDPASCSVLAVGAGDTVRTALRSLCPRTAEGRLVVVNRTRSRAESVAQEFGGRAGSLDDLPALAADADVVITATNASEPLLLDGELGPRLAGRRSRPLLVLDLGVPRDVDPSLAKRRGVYLYAVDDLHAIAERGRQERALEIPKAEAIVSLAVSDFRRRQRHLSAAPAIRSLLDGLLAMRTDVVRGEKGLTASERAAADRVTGKLVDRMLRRLAPRLKDGSAGAREVLDAFGIEPPDAD